MREADEDEALSLLAEALTTRSDPRRERTRIVDALCRLSGAEGANLLLGDHYLAPGPDIRSEANKGTHRHKEKWILAALPRYAARNPILPLLPRIEDTVYLPAEVLGVRRWQGSEYVLDYLKPIDTTTVAGMTLRGRDGAIYGGIFLGHPDPKGFAPRGLARLRSIAGSVARGLSDIAEWEAWQRRQAATLEPLLGGMSDPVVVIERTSSGMARLVSASPSAARILGLTARGERGNPELAALLAASRSASPSGEPTILWTARDGTPFEIKAAVFPTFGASMLVARLVPRAPPAAPPERRLWTQARAAGLTARESDILDALARGLSHKQIAGDLGIRYFTVTTHVRNLFAKLRASGRVEAINAVTRGAEPRRRG